ncbi:LysR family transcriptional regulator [Paenibacillus radicis (ex Gao et al. 2016)]|uniref:Transcriptional regulator n=1 Tax=Paenibacillus radicis (ex Gao et al. 2016) TaxID=1737354 RepID=A0A917M2E0_9BACL|nr:LysR family transcriptional regulator [Paenibacillus radicis (ex Gao et al. 2016)]GGG72510.1 transcriptional regulator [Paenibacillus radicis (ex Gao et al. 2016)]
MNLDNIEAFVYVVHFNSFRKAADALFLTQPSISSRIRTLEKELGVDLLIREGKRFSLTQKGEIFLPHAQQTLKSFKKAEQLMSGKTTEVETLRLGCTETMSHYVVPLVMPKLKARFPNFQIRIVTDNSDSIIEKVLNKEVDLGFVRSVSHPALESVRFIEDPIKLCVYQGHPFLQEPPLSIEALESEPLVFYECGSLNWTKIHRLFETLSHPPKIDYHTDNMETAKKLVLEREGISFLPMLCIRREIKEGLLIPVTIPSLSELSLVTNLIALKGSSSSIFEAVLEINKELKLIERFY